MASSVLTVDEAVAKTRRFLRRQDVGELVAALGALHRNEEATSRELEYLIIDELYRRDRVLLGVVDDWCTAVDDDRPQVQVVLDYYDAAG